MASFVRSPNPFLSMSAKDAASSQTSKSDKGAASSQPSKLADPGTPWQPCIDALRASPTEAVCTLLLRNWTRAARDGLSRPGGPWALAVVDEIAEAARG